MIALALRNEWQQKFIWGYSSAGRARYPVSDPKGCYKIASFDKFENSQKVVKQTVKAADCTSFRVKIFRETEYGGIAQLGERLNGIQEVSGSIPLISTKATLSEPVSHRGWVRTCCLSGQFQRIQGPWMVKSEGLEILLFASRFPKQTWPELTHLFFSLPSWK